MIAFNTCRLTLAKIRRDLGCNVRATIKQGIAKGYAERMLTGDGFPPVDVYFDGQNYWLADGFHRVAAAALCGSYEIASNVYQGTVDDAIWHGIGANRAHGLKLSKADKRRAVEMALIRFPEKTQAAIAHQIGCSQSYVAQIQLELIIADKLSATGSRVGKDGKTRPTTYKKAKNSKFSAVERKLRQLWKSASDHERKNFRAWIESADAKPDFVVVESTLVTEPDVPGAGAQPGMLPNTVQGSEAGLLLLTEGDCAMEGGKL